MKRLPGLRALSDDHHQGLVLALKAKRAGTGNTAQSVSEIWSELQARFASELEPHFLIEESLLIPPLERAGEAALVRRLHDEHAALRRQVLLTQTAENLERFGTLLEQHIRFEERELFEAAQRILDPSSLEAIAAACHQHTQT